MILRATTVFARPVFTSSGTIMKWRTIICRSNPLAPIGRKAFLDYWPIRRPAASRERIYRSFRWGRARGAFYSRRAPVSRPEKKHDARRGAKAMALRRHSPLVGDFQICRDERADGRRREAIVGMVTQRNEQNFCVTSTRKKSRGVYFLSADMHYAAITKIPKGGGLKDITAGPWRAQLNRITNGTAAAFRILSCGEFQFRERSRSTRRADPANRPASNSSIRIIESFTRRRLSAGIEIASELDWSGASTGVDAYVDLRRCSSASGLSARVSLPCHIVENVGHGVFGKAFEARIRRPTEMRRQHDVVELQQRMILRQWFFDEDIQSAAPAIAFSFRIFTSAISSTMAPRAVLTR